MLLLQEFNENACNGPSFHDVKFLTKNEQPKELFLSSDANALVEHTKKVLVIEDGEVVHLKVFSFSLTYSQVVGLYSLLWIDNMLAF